ncbi:NAD(P)-binding protein [Zopfia rhizophila CBS 207.26]|uniref:NAD(P)-binding protein n=1 Tax=Zopfia rhizophila CBS 207.26 TaxID=1314779 RepID=A0A6A6DPI9_9PEZI|nr:NAD(P)-binding protein [Zopfia rhizophila CBS 207.26]
MDRAKETLHKAVRPATDVNKHNINTQRQAKPGLQWDMEPKPTKVHLQSSDPDYMYRLSLCVPSGKLAGKEALITGSDLGIGRAVAILFAMEGAKVVIVYLPAEEEDAQHTKAQTEKNGGEVLLIASDLSNAINCKDVIERAGPVFGGIDILVNNAAFRQEQGDISDITKYNSGSG